MSTTAPAVIRYQSTLYHDLMSPAEILSVREEVRRFADEYVAPEAYRIGHTEEAVENFPRQLFARMAEAGLFRIPFAAEVGGRGLQYPTAATAVMIVIARAIFGKDITG